MKYQRLRTLLERHYGWATEAIHDREIQNAVQAQAHVLSLDYDTQSDRILSIICQDPKLLARIAESLAVHETWFFRSNAQLQNAVDFLATRRVQMGPASPDLPLRVLSAPCSTGEEAYSFALLLSQRGLTCRDVIIDGLDQSQLAIDRARIARYNRNSFREPNWDNPSVIPGIHPQGEQWEIDRQIADMVRFRVANLLDMPSFPGQLAPQGQLALQGQLDLQGQFDCIFCRNLLIYLSLSKRIELLRQLTQWLTPNGRIYVSAVEAPIAHEAGLTAIAPRELQIFVPSSSPPVIAAPPTPFLRSPRQPRTSLPVERLGTRSFAAYGTTAHSTTTRLDAAPKRDLQAELLRAEQAADAGRFNDAEAILKSLSPNEQLSASAQFLRGVIAQAQGKLDEAQYAWEQTVYLDPHHGPALQRLWLAATSRGDRRLAEQYRRRWLKRRVES